ncbi:hypothetical protein [Planctomicrobium sp. SH664]|uniref:hypothetical protein n=1 Tax=Planctomicrobium sp. SH664 TaxID=3448125 RepID=UPI003F5C50CA
MNSPYEELEYLADHLPEEGETLLVSRESGELICKSVSRSNLRGGIEDAELYGLLVKANERLHAAGVLPLWLSVIGVVWAGILLHLMHLLSWSGWFFVPGLAFVLLFAVFQWIRIRQRKLFRQKILPGLRPSLLQHGISPAALIAGVRQHVELRAVLDELIEWEPNDEFTLT